MFGPEVKALAGRYLQQMLDDIKELPDPDGIAESLLDSIEITIPHQANKTMVIDLAASAGLSADRLYFNIEQMGNTSAASIPLAIRDAVRDGVITKPTRVFAPGFGAGAVAGSDVVLRIDPAVIAPDDQAAPDRHVRRASRVAHQTRRNRCCSGLQLKGARLRHRHTRRHVHLGQLVLDDVAGITESLTVGADSTDMLRELLIASGMTLKNPAGIFAANARLVGGVGGRRCGPQSAARSAVTTPGPIAIPSGDKRFSDAAYQDNPAYFMLAQQYLLFTQYVAELLDTAGVSGAREAKARFAARFLVDALAPTKHPCRESRGDSQSVRHQRQERGQGSQKPGA